MTSPRFSRSSEASLPVPPILAGPPVFVDPFPPYPGDPWMLAALPPPSSSSLPFVCRVWPQPETCVVLGRGCHAESDILLDAAEAAQLPIYRREGGGGTVVLSQGMLILAVAAHVRDPFANKRYFEIIQTPLTSALSDLGLSSIAQRGLSDLAAFDRKILGSSLRRQKSLLLYQAVLLVDSDRSIFQRYLRYPPREPDYRQGRDHNSFTITLRELGLALSLLELQAFLQTRLETDLPLLLADELLSLPPRAHDADQTTG